jgi:outer membrane receptor protein involved in Fe transport
MNLLTCEIIFVAFTLPQQKQITMFKILITLILLFVNMLVSSQTSIKGVVVNQNNKPIELAEVLLVNKDSITIKNEFTKPSGAFSLAIEKGDYVLQLRQLGKIMYKQAITVIDNLDLGTITITESKQQLEEVTVTSKKKLIERKVDRLVFNVENSISASGGDALDALRVTPGLRVQNDAISMIGKSGMAVMVDDRIIQLQGDDLINFLKTIKADNIKSVEVITTPPAKYEAEGNSGLINIKLKRAKANSWGATLTGAYKQTTYATGSFGGSFNYQKNKVSLVVNSNYSNGAYQGVENSNIFYPKQSWNSEGKGKYITNALSNRIGFDYQLSKKWDMGVQYIGSYNKPNISDADNTILTDNITSTTNAMINTAGNSIRKKDLNSLNWHTNFALDTLGKKVSVDFDFLDYKSTIDRNFYSNTINSTAIEIPNQFILANNLTNQKISNYAAQINVTHPLKWANLSYGTKFSFSKTNNEINYFDTTTTVAVFDPSQSDLFKYTENTQALYFSGNKNWANNKWEMQLGLRMENTQIEGNSITTSTVTKNDYTQFFPTLYLKYAPTQNNSYSLNYSKRISRPNFGQLNPFKWYTSPYVYSEGNPYLQPVYAHNFELNYAFKDYLTTSIYYSNNKNNSGQVGLFNGSDYLQKITRLNYFDNYNIAIQQTYMYTKLKWLENQNTLVVYFQHSDSKIFPITPKTSEGFGASISTSNTFMINKTIVSGFELQYNFPHQSSDLVYNFATTQLAIYSRMFFLNKKLQLTIAANNLFKANDYYNKSSRNNVAVIYKGYYDTLYFGCNISYKLGSSKINVSKRQVSNEDEKGRTN